MDTRNITRFFKGVAIVFVLICHSQQTFDLPGGLNKALSFFQIGVQMFMVLSAMGLCFSYSTAPLGWTDFMKKRLSKIAVPYWSAIVLAALYRVAYAVLMHKDILREMHPLGMFVNVLMLHGVTTDSFINNHIVRGGWFVGAIVVLYALFPLLWRLYFGKNKTWKKVRLYLFPLITFATSMIFAGVTKHFFPEQALVKVFLQLAPFCLGFPLFELQKSGAVGNVKWPLIKAVFFTVCSVLFYFSETSSQPLYMFLIAVGFCYIIIFVLKNQKAAACVNSRSPISGFFQNMGGYSFLIYLTHSYIVFDLCYVLLAVMSHIYHSDLLWFILFQPFVMALAYYVGKYFERITVFIVSKQKQTAA